MCSTQEIHAVSPIPQRWRLRTSGPFEVLDEQSRSQVLRKGGCDSLPRLACLGSKWKLRNGRIEFPINPHSSQTRTVINDRFGTPGSNVQPKLRHRYFLYMFIPPVSTEQTQTRFCSGSLMQMRLAPSRIGLRYLLMVWDAIPINDKLRCQIS